MLAAAAHSTPVGEYIAIVLTAGLAVIGWLFRQTLASLRKLHSEASTNSAGLAVLVERVSPVTAELADHDERLRGVENGHARLEGALAEHRHLVAAVLQQRQRRD